jgi:hypothetical protein
MYFDTRKSRFQALQVKHLARLKLQGVLVHRLEGPVLLVEGFGYVYRRAERLRDILDELRVLTDWKKL